jgi:ATPase subunit of ABC transporter with duplicated ATPase domains
MEVDMLTVHQLAKSFALKSLFSDVTFNVNHGDRVGLVGPNGCGKTTLLRIIANEEAADSGHVARSHGTRIGYLPQGFEISARASVAEVIGRVSGDVAALESELVDLTQALAIRPNDASLQIRYDALLRRISEPDTGLAARILAGLGLDSIPADSPVSQLSGGQQTRLSLALVLLGEPQLLLLDEPTIHLDIEMLEWLEEWLTGFAGGVLIVSHDRTFLDHTVSRILALDPLKHTVREYAGNYSDYVEQLNQERQRQWTAYRDQREEIRRIRQDIRRAKAQAEHTERQASSVRIGGEMMKLKGYKDYQQSIAKKVAKKAKSREQKLVRYLESEDRVEKPRQMRNIRLEFSKLR